MKIYLVRHAESTGNISPSFNGLKDVPLSDNGRIQAKLLKSFFADKTINRIYTSMLRRTVETAGYALPGRRKEFISLGILNEINGGDWEGREYTEIFERWGDEFRKWREAPHEAQPPNGENVYDVLERAKTALNRIVSENDDDSTVAVFAHGALIKTIIIYLRSLPMSELVWVAWYENSSVTEINYENGQFSLGFCDNHDHLPDDLKTVANSDWGKAMKRTCRY